MELLNATGMESGYTLGLDPDGRERLVVVVKGTFLIPEKDMEPPLADEQLPLVMADEFTGEPGESATLYESDFAPYKPYCDVLLNGSAYAPGGMPVSMVQVGLSIGKIRKTFNVTGDRIWTRGLLGMKMSKPVPFTKKVISYDFAFGGVDAHPREPDARKTYLLNPIGTGYYPYSSGRYLAGKPLPNTEEIGSPVKSTTGRYKPMSFGPICRNFPSRIALAGTYDQQWLDNVFPFLPSDFNPGYFQAAPPDQQINYLRGGEQVMLFNLTPIGQTIIRLPGMEVPVEFSTARYKRIEAKAVIDTIVIEPDARRFTLTWRASLPLKRDIFEIAQVTIGRMSRAWYRARETGKEYYPSVCAYIQSKREEESELSVEEAEKKPLGSEPAGKED